ncbi:MAG: hypothetical protein ACPL3C_00400 [Pyrobaculum sp.]|uniref:hypothetical protein n=1 Tax=Pyrobaculum sp. TaxID=2004705 RepID=UPI003CA495E4
MNTLTKLLIITGFVIATAAVVLASLGAIYNLHPELYALAKSIAAGRDFHIDNPVNVEVFQVAYSYTRRGAVLVGGSGNATPALYAVAFGNSCPPIDGLLGRLYTTRNNTVVVDRCAYILPTLEDNEIIHYFPTCKSGTDFRPEAITTIFTYRGNIFKATLYVIRC